MVEHYIRDKNQPLDFGDAEFGSYKFFDRRTGNIEKEIIYENGVKIIQRRFFENGQIQGETIRGKSDRWWYENGQMQKEIIRDNNMSGKIIQTTQWDENGIRIN